ncbi:hypothetical protein [Streptomyces sp. NPDC054804]
MADAYGAGSGTGDGVAEGDRPGGGALAPHSFADYVVRPPGGFRAVRPRTCPVAVTGTPMTITTARVPADAPSAR